MSKEQVEKIVERALDDAKFRELLKNDPAKACAEYDITSEELESVKEASGDIFSGKLDQRISKKGLGKFGGFSGPMGIDGIQE